MPELPEVQTVVSDLNKKIKGDRITDFWTDFPKAIKNKSEKEFKKEIIGRKILDISRIGKNILIQLEGNKTLYIHLKMTGHLLVKNAKLNSKNKSDFFADRVNQYIHHIWYLKRGQVPFLSPVHSKESAKKVPDPFFDKALEFSDLRKFAKIMLVDTDKVDKLPEIKALGIDAMSKEFSLKKFQEILAKHQKKTIRDILMQQTIIAGVGNIYASEILFAAGILPSRKASDLTVAEIKEVYQDTIKILKKAIQLRGTSDSDYRDTDGAPGGFQKILKVYNREKHSCQRKGCQGVVKREKIKQRSAFYCENCQK